MDDFKFSVGDVVLAEWEDKVFYAKIQKIDRTKSYCLLIFDDNSVEECPFSKIHSVTETTAEIVCIICKDGTSVQPNEIVLCDKCGIGYHQKCHDPSIPAKAVEIDEPWMCTYCCVGAFCPYLENPFEAKDKKGPLKKRRLLAIRKEGSVSSGNSTEDEGILLSRRVVGRGMSGFYYASPSHHREGHRPRGRPPFSHKRHVSEKRGRGSGRSPGRPPIRDRDHQTERDCDLELSSRKPYTKHSEMQQRPHARYGSPSRNTRHGEDVESSGSDISLATRDSNSISSSGRKCSEDTASKSALLLKAQRRDAPREKQRLTQDLARQKRLLSEDIARAQQLQKEQIAKNFELMDKKDSPQSQNEFSHDANKISTDYEREKEREFTMYEKCYGTYSPDYQQDSSREDARSTGENTMDKNSQLSVDGESLFERVLHKGVKETKSIEFVNDNNLEIRGVQYNEGEVDGEMAKTNPHSPFANNGGHNKDQKEKLELPIFENVTDDELATSDVDGSGNSGPVNDLNGLPSPDDVLVTREGTDSNVEGPLIVDNSSVIQLSDESRDVYGAKEILLEQIDTMNCECASIEGDTNGAADRRCGELNGVGLEDLYKLDHQPDHSIKNLKIKQLLDEPDIQCEHSTRNEDHSVTEIDSHDPTTTCTKEEQGHGQVEFVGNRSEKVLEFERDARSSPQVCEEGSSLSDWKINSVEGLGINPEGLQNFPDDKVEEKESKSALYGHDSDLSNNEGMSDAEELSDSELVSPTGRSKVRRKRRKKTKSAKSHAKPTNSPQRQPRRSKTGRRLGRPPKASKRVRQMESDSDENEGISYEGDGDMIGSKTEGNTTAHQTTKNPDDHIGSLDKKINEDIESKLESEERGDIPQDASGVLPESVENRITEGAICDNKGEDSPCELDDLDGQSIDSLKHLDSDTEDASQEIFSLTEAERLELEEQGRKERVRKEKRIAARQKRKSEERDKERERATPPHLVSQNRFARDLPRHNWLVERLLQQNKLCQEALKQTGSGNQNPDNPDVKSDDEQGTSVEVPAEDTVQEKAPEEAVYKEISSEAEEAREVPSSPQRDEFQSELHRSFLRRSFPSNVPRTPPKLKPASPDAATGGDNKPAPPPLKHKLQSKELSALEPVPKLKKIVTEKPEKDTSEETSFEKASDSVPSPKEPEPIRKPLSPIEILDDEEEKKKQGVDSKESKQTTSPELKTVLSDKSESREESRSPTSKMSSFSPPKKPVVFSSSNKIVHSVSPTLPGSANEMGSSLHMPPHHRAAILIPVVPMHDGNGLPIPPSLGPTSPHLKGCSPRTFTPHLITHNVPFSTSGLFGGPLPPSSRYTSTSCMHHMHTGIKTGPCKRDVNCPFHGSTPRGMHSGILGIPSHHGPIPAFSQHSHEQISQMLAREHGEKGHCPNSDCKLCRHGKGSPKLREIERGSGEKIPPQILKVVKPIAHVPGMRPPLMLSHLQQLGGRPPHGFGEIEGLSDEKSRRPGVDPRLSPRHFNKSPERSPRDPMVPGLSLQERRTLSQPLTLSDLNRRREQDLLKCAQEDSVLGLKQRPILGEFLPPGFSSPPVSLGKPGLLHPKDAVMFSTIRGQPCVVSQADKRDLRRMEEREHATYMAELLKSGPPRLRPLEEPRELSALRQYGEHKKREELAMRESFLARENAAFLRRLSAKEAGGIPPAKLFDDRGPIHHLREPSIPTLSRSSKDFDMRILGSHGNSSILSLGFRNLEDHRKLAEEERKGENRDEFVPAQRRGAPGETKSRERERCEDLAMKELERRRSIEVMHEKEQEKQINAEREAMGGLVMNRDRLKDPLLHGPDAEKHFKATFRLPRERSPPFMRGDHYPERLISGVLSRPDHRLDIRAAAMQDLQRRQEAIRAGEASHRELLGRMASSHSAHKPGNPADRHLAERIHTETSRSLVDVRSHSPMSRTFPLSMASRQAMDRLAAAAQGKTVQLIKEPEKDIPPHLRAEMERERERERHRLSLEQIDANRRLLHAELKEKVNPLVLNREMGLRDREKEIAALRVRERQLLERERFMAIERLAEERKRKREAGEPEGPFGPQGRRLHSPPFGRLHSPPFGHPLDRAKRMKTTSEPPTSGPRPHPPHLTPPSSHPMEGKSKDDRSLLSPNKASMEQRMIRPLELELPNKTSSAMLEREAMWMRERERAMRAREELSRMKVNVPLGSHVPGFPSNKDRPDVAQRDANSCGKTEEEGVNLCSVCKSDASFLCSGCQGAWYCSHECQLSAWSKHSRDCGQSQRQ